jgi:hypothetical protein
MPTRLILLYHDNRMRCTGTVPSTRAERVAHACNPELNEMQSAPRLVIAIFVSLLSLLSNLAIAAAVGSGTPIAIENTKTGTALWALKNPALQHEIEGYPSSTSVNRGESISFYVRTSAPTFNIDVFRMGYYAGTGARLMYSAQNIVGSEQTYPCANPNGIIECNWAVSHTLAIPNAATDPSQPAYWTSGVYLARITTNDTAKKDSYMIFVVRDDNLQATYVAQLPVTTYQAYNYWGGRSLYTGCLNHAADWSCAGGEQKANAVSFSRPYTPSSNPAAAYGAGAGEFLTNVQTVQEGYPISSAGFDYNMVRWVERQGYDVKYVTNVDLHRDANLLNGAYSFISFGHDEYYSSAMWDHLVTARNAGINLAFFSSNQIYWRIRFDAGYYGQANGIITCYKYVTDPVTGDAKTGLFRDLGKPEAALIGGQYVAAPVTGDIAITNASHWLYAGSGATNTSVLRGLLGYEVNAIIPGTSPANVESLAHTSGAGFKSDISYYVAPSAAQVFATGSMAWSWGLDSFFSGGLRQDYSSTIAQKVTANVLDALAETSQDGFTNGASGFYLATANGNLNPAQVIQDAAPAGASKTNWWRVIPSASGTVRIVSRATGYCLDAYGTGTGAVVGTWGCNGGPNQEWTLTDQGNGYATIRDSRSNLCLEVPSAAMSAKTGLVLGACSQQPKQLWHRQPVSGTAPVVQPPTTNPGSDIQPNVTITLSESATSGFLTVSRPAGEPLTYGSNIAPEYRLWKPVSSNQAGYFTVVSVANGLCLDAYGTAVGALAGTWECHGEDNQNWSFVTLGSATYTLADRRSGLCLTRGTGGNVLLGTCQASVDQRWLKIAPAAPVTSTVTFTSQASTYLLAVATGTGASGVTVQAPAGNGYATQWTVTTLSDGYLQLSSTANGYCLDSYGTTDGASIGTWECHLGDNQRWQLIPSGNGTVALSDKRSGKCVDNKGQAAAGAPLVLASCNGSPSQAWLKNG